LQTKAALLVIIVVFGACQVWMPDAPMKTLGDNQLCLETGQSKADSTIASYDTVPGLPSAPRDLTTKVGPNYVLLSWLQPFENGSHSITGYKVCKGESLPLRYYHSVEGNVTRYNDSGVLPGEIWFYHIHAVNENGTGPKSNIARATLPGGRLTTPEGSMDNTVLVYASIIGSAAIVALAFLAVRKKRNGR
jgi:hypothetical protein